MWVTSSSLNLDLAHIQRSLGGSSSGLEWVVNSYTLSFAVLLLTAGTVGDRIGHRQAFLYGLAIFGVASPLCSGAPTLAFLITARFVQGAGAALLVANSMALLSDTFHDPAERSKAAGVWGGVSAGGVAMGPVVGGLLVDSVGWRSVFWLNVPVVVCGVVLTLWAVPRSPSIRGRKVDVPGQVLGIVALFALTLGLTEGSSWGWTSPKFVISLLVAIAAGAAFFITEARQPDPMLPLRIFSNRAMASATGIGSILFFCSFGATFVLPLWLQNRRGYSAFDAGLFLLSFSLTGLFLSVVAGRLSARYGPRMPVTLGTASLVVAATILSLSEVATSTVVLQIALVFFGVGGALSNPPLIGVMLNAAGPAESGIASGSFNTCRQTSGLLGVVVLGTIFSSGEQLRGPFVVITIFYLSAFALTRFWLPGPQHESLAVPALQAVAVTNSGELSG